MIPADTPKSVLDIPIAELVDQGLVTLRTANLLEQWADTTYLSGLVGMTEDRFRAIPSFGENSFNELKWAVDVVLSAAKSRTISSSNGNGRTHEFPFHWSDVLEAALVNRNADHVTLEMNAALFCSLKSWVDRMQGIADD